MRIKPFGTERFFAKYEFSARHLLGASDCESLTVDNLLSLTGVSSRDLGPVRLGYTETQGAPALRRRIAALYPGATTDDVIFLGAPEEGIFLAMHALLEPGNRVVVLSPCYDSLANLAEHLGCDVVRWALVEERETATGNGGWCIDLDALRKHLKPGARLLVVNFPHNPTGRLPTADEWQTIVEAARTADAWLFSDEMYRGLEHDPANQLPSAVSVCERAIVLGGLSKTHGLAGLRAGWLVVRDPALRLAILHWKDYTSICASAPSEFLADLAIQASGTILERNREIIRGNLGAAETFFRRWKGLFRWHRPQAGPVALVGLRHASAEAFCERLVREAGVLLLPGTSLGAGDRHVRFGFGRLDCRDALACLDRYLERT